MSISSPKKRMSAASIKPILKAYKPDGSMDALDRTMSAWLYSGISIADDAFSGRSLVDFAGKTVNDFTGRSLGDFAGRSVGDFSGRTINDFTGRTLTD